MAEKIISSIKEAEIAAKEIIESRRKQNHQDLLDAMAANQEGLNKALANKSKSAKDAQEKADKDAQAQVKALTTEYETKISKITQTAKKNSSEAVKFIISKL